MSPEISLPAAHCTYAGSFCKEDAYKRILAAKVKIKADLGTDSVEGQTTAFGHCNDSSLGGRMCSTDDRNQFDDYFPGSDWLGSSGIPLKVCFGYCCSVITNDMLGLLYF